MAWRRKYINFRLCEDGSVVLWRSGLVGRPPPEAQSSMYAETTALCIQAYPGKWTLVYRDTMKQTQWKPIFKVWGCQIHSPLSGWMYLLLKTFPALQITPPVSMRPSANKLHFSLRSRPRNAQQRVTPSPFSCDPLKDGAVFTPSPTAVWTFNAITGHIGWRELRPRRPFSQREHKRFGWMVGDNPAHPSWPSLQPPSLVSL